MLDQRRVSAYLGMTCVAINKKARHSAGLVASKYPTVIHTHPHASAKTIAGRSSSATPSTKRTPMVVAT